MTKKTMYCTLDTETLGGACHPEGIYDLGGLIHDNTGKVYATFHILVAEFLKDLLEKGFYGKKNFPLYQTFISTGSATMVATEEEAINLVDNLLTLYNVKYVMAYNTNFDLERTECKKLVENREFIDIYKVAMEILCGRSSYAKYCEENNLFTKNGKYKTGVEQVYGYLIQDPDFEEEHTAFSDAYQEMDIFIHCYNAHKHFTKNEHQIKY